MTPTSIEGSHHSTTMSNAIDYIKEVDCVAFCVGSLSYSTGERSEQARSGKTVVSCLRTVEGSI